MKKGDTMKKWYVLAVLAALIVAIIVGGWAWLALVLVVFIGSALIPHNSGGPRDTYATR
jgi:hypothetical protein